MASRPANPDRTQKASKRKGKVRIICRPESVFRVCIGERAVEYDNNWTLQGTHSFVDNSDL
jgi:ribosomal protein L36